MSKPLRVKMYKALALLNYLVQNQTSVYEKDTKAKEQVESALKAYEAEFPEEIEKGYHQ